MNASARLPRPGKPVRGSQSGRPIMALLDLLGRRWALRLVWELRDRRLSFRDLLELLAGNSGALNTRLKELRHAGIVDHRDGLGYGLTPEGEKLLASLSPLHHWASGGRRGSVDLTRTEQLAAHDSETTSRGEVMNPRVQIIGNFLSPYVRKVLVCLDLKGVPYEIDPIVPFFGDDRFSQVSPVRRIPVLRDEQVTIADSSVICQYLEDRYPEPGLYPASIVDRARARWLEEFADSRMGEVFIWKLFNQVAIKPFVWGEQTDTAVVERTLREEIPQVLDYLETQAPKQGFIFGALSIADISLACFFRNAAFARFRVDAARWPLTAAFVERVLEIESFEKLKPLEDRLRRTPLGEHRAALADMGVPLTRDTYATSTPRRGMMRID